MDDQDYASEMFEYDEENSDDDFDDRRDGGLLDDDADLTDTDLRLAEYDACLTDDFANGSITPDELSDEDLEMAGTLDGEFDAEHNIPNYNGYGASVDLDELPPERKKLYDDAYHKSFKDNSKK